jgi:hypothetical protein
MNPMLLGETLSAAGSETYEGFWMPAGGNDGVAAVEVFYVSTASRFTVHLDTKSSDEVDSAAASRGSVDIDSTTPGIFRFEVTNAKDLVRYRVVSEIGAAAIHFQFSQPLWAPN